MTFQELDRAVREAIPDGIQRRLILQGIHGMEEAANQHLGYLLSVSSHKLVGEGWVKQDSTLFQVNEKI
jgi:hypothetical protein